MIINTIQKSCVHLFPKNRFVNYEIFHLTILQFPKTFQSEFTYMEVWFANQNSNFLDIEDKVNITLVIE